MKYLSLQKNFPPKYLTFVGKRNSQIVTSSEKAAQLEALKQEFNEYRAKLLEEWMWKKPRGFDKLKWQRRFRPPSRKAWTNKKRMDRVAADLAHYHPHFSLLVSYIRHA